MDSLTKWRKTQTQREVLTHLVSHSNLLISIALAFWFQELNSCHLALLLQPVTWQIRLTSQRIGEKSHLSSTYSMTVIVHLIFIEHHNTLKIGIIFMLWMRELRLRNFKSIVYMCRAGKWQNLYLKLGLSSSKACVPSSNVISIAEPCSFSSRLLPSPLLSSPPLPSTFLPSLLISSPPLSSFFSVSQ